MPRPPVSLLRRSIALLAIAAVACETEEAAPAADPGAGGCPGVSGETVRWIVTSTPGGSLDVGSRLLEPFYEAALGAELVVENRSGAGGGVGARVIRDADPNGLTLGMINGTGRLVADLSDEIVGLHPLRNFTVLGRLATEDPVWLARAGSPLGSIDDVLARAEDGPVIFSISEVGASSFVFASVPSDLLRLPVTYVGGYPGGREQSLGLIRGEVDVDGSSFESMRDRIESGELVPILQISDRPVADHPSLTGVPLFAGQDGVAARTARSRGTDPAPVVAQAAALSELFQLGRLVVAPPGLAPELAQCLADRLAEVVADPAFLEAAARANRTINHARPEQLRAELTSFEQHREALASIIRRHVQQARGSGGGN